MPRDINVAATFVRLDHPYPMLNEGWSVGSMEEAQKCVRDFRKLANDQGYCLSKDGLRLTDRRDPENIRTYDNQYEVDDVLGVVWPCRLQIASLKLSALEDCLLHANLLKTEPLPDSLRQDAIWHLQPAETLEELGLVLMQRFKQAHDSGMIIPAYGIMVQWSNGGVTSWSQAALEDMRFKSDVSKGFLSSLETEDGRSSYAIRVTL